MAGIKKSPGRQERQRRVHRRDVMLTSAARGGQASQPVEVEEGFHLLPPAAQATPPAPARKLREKARVFNPYDALSQLKPGDTLAAMLRGSFQ
jgi:hypothetical protein